MYKRYNNKVVTMKQTTKEYEEYETIKKKVKNISKWLKNDCEAGK